MAPQAVLSTLDGFILLAVLYFVDVECSAKEELGAIFKAVQACRTLAGRSGGCDDFELWSICCISGSSVATAATIGTVAIPEMVVVVMTGGLFMGFWAGGTLVF